MLLGVGLPGDRNKFGIWAQHSFRRSGSKLNYLMPRRWFQPWTGELSLTCNRGTHRAMQNMTSMSGPVSRKPKPQIVVLGSTASVEFRLSCQAVEFRLTASTQDQQLASFKF